MERRKFIIWMAGILFAMDIDKKTNVTPARIALVRTRKRSEGVREAVKLLGMNPFKEKWVLIKPNFNSADPPPASTHNETLEEIIKICQESGSKKVSIGERSGFAGFIKTEDVLRRKGIYELAESYGVEVINFDELKDTQWIKFKPEGSHWLNGFKVAEPVIKADSVVSTCCLKTHRFGGVFTMSLKLSVGIVKKSYMAELHSSFFNMRKMIAEINIAYNPSLIVLDGVDAFVDGGPEKGVLKEGNVIIAGADRIAVDAVGVAVLKDLGSNKKIMKTKIFEHDQIKRAVELGIGISSPSLIEIITPDEESEKYARKIRKILEKEGA